MLINCTIPLVIDCKVIKVRLKNLKNFVIKFKNYFYKFCCELVYMSKICYIDLTVRLKNLVAELNNPQKILVLERNNVYKFGGVLL